MANEPVHRLDKIIIGFCTGLLIILFLSVGLMLFTRIVIVKKLGINNGFTKLIFAENTQLNDDASFQPKMIDWSLYYPFDESIIDGKKRKKLEKYVEKITQIESNLQTYTSTFLLGYRKFAELSKYYDNIIAWNFVSYNEYNGVSELKDGYLTEFIEKRDSKESANFLIEFAKWVESNGIDFLYVQAPYKVSEYDDIEISGYIDFSNQNANDMISDLKRNLVRVLDLRDCIQKEGLNNHGLFYKTDHHWLTTTGLWASKQLLDYCNKECGFNANTSLIDLGHFKQKVYSEWFLGSYGKKVTLARARPEDFVLLYPDYETKFHYVVPAMNIDNYGDYLITYNMKLIEKKDYYSSDTYAACNYGEQPLVIIDNELARDYKKILIIRDSFADCMLSGMALCESHIEALDLRRFNGSVKAYIKETEPDMVIVMYTAGVIGDEINLESHNSMFDFR